MTQQKHTGIRQNNQTERKEPERRHKKQRPTCLHTESPKNTRLEAILYVQRTRYRPMQALCIPLHYLWVQICYDRTDLWSLVYLVSSIPSSSTEIPASCGEQVDGDIPLGTEYSKSLILCIVPSCASLRLFLSVVGGTFSDYGRARTDLWVYKNVLRSNSIAKLFRTVVFGFTQICEPCSLRLLVTQAVSSMGSVSWSRP